jgi:serine/threonine protein kinase
MKPPAGIQRVHDASGQGAPDATIGRLIAERYEILAPIKEGGMGRVYVALQRSLKRKVALKLIHPGVAGVSRIADRFLSEAQAASQLNHPNVVSVYDFGQSGDGAEPELFLVMELLTGSDLRTLLDSHEVLAPARIIEILRQTLAGLAEAHEHGISHRDIKPDNIVLEQTRRGTDRVKLIDFGVARVEKDESLTLTGQFVGTPWYAAPEQIRGEHGPLADLYSLGVVLFEMLTGDVPFDDPSPVQILVHHQTAPRPDPAKARGRHVPRPLADVCMRAMAVDPAKRFSDAEEMADALLHALESRAAVSRRAESLFPRRTRSSVPSSSTAMSADAPPVPDGIEGFGLIDSVLPEESALPATDLLPLIGRAEDMAWARSILEGDDAKVVVYGRPGVGRSRFLKEIAKAMEESSFVVRVAASPSPQNEIGYRALREIVVLLSGLAPTDLATGAGVPEVAAVGLRLLFGSALAGTSSPSVVRRALAASFLWGASAAVARMNRGSVVLCIDDADKLDGVSLVALGDALAEPPVPGFKVVLTSRECPDKSKAIFDARELHGFGVPAVTEWLTFAGAKSKRIARTDDEVEALYLEYVWSYLSEGAEPPEVLSELVGARVEGLYPSERRLLQALAVTGGGTMEDMAAILPGEEGLEHALQLLVDGHLAEVVADTAFIPHRLVAEKALASAPTGTIAGLHARAADALQVDSELVELRAFHAARGRVDFEAFLLVEEATRLRSARGDHEGALTMLIAGLEAATTKSQRGDVAAISAETVFARKIGAVLVSLGRFEEALAFLERALADTTLSAAERSLALEQVSICAATLGRADDAERRRNEALAMAQRSNDAALIERLGKPVGTYQRSASTGLYRTPYGRTSTSLPAMRAVEVARPSSVVRRDPRREED